MGRNVFVSYKYGDNDVRQFRNSDCPTSSRDYVNVIKEILEETEFFYFNGEEDGLDLSRCPEELIREHLYDKIFRTSITMVLITPNMRRRGVPEMHQWIPREISYSLRNKERGCGPSNMNAMLCVVIPDRHGSYDHAVRRRGRDLMIDDRGMFRIIGENLCNNVHTNHRVDSMGRPVYRHGGSYFVFALWDDFRMDPEHYLDLAVGNREHWEDYRVRKSIDPEW